MTYKYQGRHFRLTDVHGNVVKSILARCGRPRPMRDIEFFEKHPKE